ncbi:hypothetical protein BDV93DRAFT_603647 [Ceratobasidium sp. AG-I]|nr:hypothetical protein BDV93DRAFT_603647 [Ceratobasidium sp. AG-I]
MGQANSNLQPELQLQPGTYRIVSGLTGTAIQVSEHDHSKVVAWEKHDGKNQQWFVQNSGGGYKLKNCQHGFYLAVPSTDIHTLVYASRFPMTWVLLKSGDCYIVQYADNNRVLDLHFGWASNGNEIHIWPADSNGNKTWRFERISDDSGEELPEVFRKEGSRLKQELDTKNQELVEMRKKLTEKDQSLVEKSSVLSRQEATIRQLEQDLKAKAEELAQVRQANSENLQLRSQQIQLQSELSQQQAETASLQGKMDRFEYLMAQMMKKDEERLANIP